MRTGGPRSTEAHALRTPNAQTIEQLGSRSARSARARQLGGAHGLRVRALVSARAHSERRAHPVECAPTQPLTRQQAAQANLTQATHFVRSGGWLARNSRRAEGHKGGEGFMVQDARLGGTEHAQQPSMHQRTSNLTLSGFSAAKASFED